MYVSHAHYNTLVQEMNFLVQTGSYNLIPRLQQGSIRASGSPWDRTKVADRVLLIMTPTPRFQQKHKH